MADNEYSDQVLPAVVGLMADAATADDLNDVTTTSAHAKLRLLLLRMSGAGIFSADIQGVARTELDTMLAQLAIYFRAAGAALAVTMNPGAGARANLQLILQDLADMLAGATGIVTFPAAAAAGNGVSVAEVVRYIQDKVNNLPAVDIDGVYLDQAAGEAGTAFPIGTPTRPVLTIADALTICTARKLKKIYVYGNLALTQSIPNTRAVIGIPVSDLPTFTWNGFHASGRIYNFWMIVDSTSNVGTFIDCRVSDNKIAPSTCENLYVVLGFKFLNALGGYSISFRPYCGFQDTALTINANDSAGEDFLVSLEPCDVTITNMTQMGYYLHLKMNGGIVRIAASCNAGASSELWLRGRAQVIVDPAATITIRDYTEPVLYERSTTAVNITAIAASETNVFLLAQTNPVQKYRLGNLRLKCADPGANTVTIRLYQMVNNVLTVVDTFDITTANFANYFNLADMFGVMWLEGKQLRVTVQASGEGPYAIAGQYDYAQGHN